MKSKKNYTLKLFVAGGTAKSTRAIINLKKICDEHLQGHYDLEIIDIHQHPEKVEKDEVIGAPFLIKKRPLPVRRLVGDLSDTARVLATLDLDQRSHE